MLRGIAMLRQSNDNNCICAIIELSKDYLNCSRDEYEVIINSYLIDAKEMLMEKYDNEKDSNQSGGSENNTVDGT